jgi:hypothetical protein
MEELSTQYGWGDIFLPLSKNNGFVAGKGMQI